MLVETDALKGAVNRMKRNGATLFGDCSGHQERLQSCIVPYATSVGGNTDVPLVRISQEAR